MKIPAGVNIKIEGTTVQVRGPKGELVRTFPVFLKISQETGVVRVQRSSDERVQRASHGMARALWSIGAQQVDTTVVREQRPYMVVTEGSFSSAASMLKGFLSGVGLEAEAQIENGNGTVRLTFAFREWTAPEAGDEDGETKAWPLADAPSSYRFVLTDGEFVDAVGFEIDDRGRAAVMLDPGELEEEDGRWVTYSLTWTTEAGP